MARIHYHDIEALYVAYFNRPADVKGLEYWSKVADATNGDLSPISAAFAASAEYAARFAGMNAYTVVDNVYQNLFGRHAEQSGLNYWASKLDDGSLTIDAIVEYIAAGARGSDKAILTYKTVAAFFHTAAALIEGTIYDFDYYWYENTRNDFVAELVAEATPTLSIKKITDNLISNPFDPLHVTTVAGPSGIAISGGADNDIIVLPNRSAAGHATLVYSTGQFGKDLVLNFAVEGVGADRFDFSALGGLAEKFSGAEISNAHGAITIQAQTDANDSAAKIAALYTDGNVDSAHVYIAYDAIDVGKVYRAVDTAAGAVNVTLVGTINLVDTEWAILTSANFV